MTTPTLPTYPFTKVTLNLATPRFASAMSASLRADDPDTARLLAEGWTVTRRWEVTGPRETRELPLHPAPAIDSTGTPVWNVWSGSEHYATCTTYEDCMATCAALTAEGHHVYTDAI